MIKVEFAAKSGKLHGFSVKGHAGFDVNPHDIVCASVSSMTNLVCNTVTEVFGAKINVCSDENIPLVEMKVISFGENEKSVLGVLEGFFIELSELEKQYPKFVSVKKIEK